MIGGTVFFNSFSLVFVCFFIFFFQAATDAEMSLSLYENGSLSCGIKRYGKKEKKIDPTERRTRLCIISPVASVALGRCAKIFYQLRRSQPTGIKIIGKKEAQRMIMKKRRTLDVSTQQVERSGANVAVARIFRGQRQHVVSAGCSSPGQSELELARRADSQVFQAGEQVVSVGEEKNDRVTDCRRHVRG